MTWVRTALPGVSDQQVVAYAIAESRLLLTFDKDFGELNFRLGEPASCGIVLFRIAPASPEHVARTAVAVLESRDDWAGHFSVIEATRVRMIPVPRP